MSIIVQKYGGSSVADIDKIKKVAERVVGTKEAGNQVVVVVSAMGRTTDVLLSLAKQINPSPSTRELDMLLTVGERITVALLSMAIQSLGHQAISFTGSQSGIITNASHSKAKIIEVRPFRIQDELANDKIVIVAGYQGVSYKREITTLGRGGSDTTAVALAAALDAKQCEIYSDIDGVYTSDPQMILNTRKIEALTYDEMLELSRCGAKVLCQDAVEFARRSGIAIYARSTFAPAENEGSVVRKDLPVERPLTGVAVQKKLVDLVFTATSREDFDVAMELILNLAQQNEVEWWYFQGGQMDKAFVISAGFNYESLMNWRKLTEALESELRGNIRITSDHGAVSLIGGDIGNRADIIRDSMDVLKRSGACPRKWFTHPLSVSFILPSDQLKPSAQTLHDHFLKRPVEGE